jgi:hypothetical protein
LNTFGAITLPIASPDTGESVSDPALDVLLSFCKAVLNAEASTAWGVRAAGETPIVRETFAHNPEVGDFVDRDLPALFLYREGGGTFEDDGIDFQRENTTLRLRWVMPDGEQIRRTDRTPILSGIGKALAAAISAGRHPSWVVATDLADTDALRLPAATSTSPQTISGAGFNGALAGDGVHAARPISITTTAAVGAYNTTDPIELTFLLKDGDEFTEEVYLTNANGGETVAAIWPAALEVSAVIPAQLLTTGTIAIGYADSPEVTLGSLVKRTAGLSRLELAGPGRPNTLPITVEEGKTLRYSTIDFDLRIQEILIIDKASAFDSFSDADDEGAGQGPLPMFIEIIHPEPDGEVIESAYFPDA